MSVPCFARKKGWCIAPEHTVWSRCSRGSLGPGTGHLQSSKPALEVLGAFRVCRGAPLIAAQHQVHHLIKRQEAWRWHPVIPSVDHKTREATTKRERLTSEIEESQSEEEK
ncbi:hypothetical protein NDU88_004260 [Pleurodeles waltl]|uniref:Uncharacterized protein n=1 Tax=Pleurodeles waltl TaxID=8319 RepID=A0AAV7V2H9_PLEWA|nr:hypothetical protein NDU88_004260 [Pleurodeles waltl]